jgi:hypothetical protein
MADIFISYTGSDRDWAFWLGKELEALGHITTLARALMRRTENGKHYGQITAKAFAVLQAPLVWGSLSRRALPDLQRDIGIFTCRR